MKLLKFLFATLISGTVFCLPVSAQNDVAVLNKIIAKTAKLYNDQPVEKVYLHLDKPYYAIGDTIWFKAYLTIDRHQPSPLSKIIYVDVFGPRDSLIESLKLPVKNSVAWANIALSQYNFHKGNYRIVAYTNWMNNSDPGYFFNKSITIGNAVNNELSTQVSLKNTTENNVSKITAGVYYKDDQGKPYADKKVSWTAQKLDEIIAKGRETTDANGFITISFANTKNYGLDSVTIAATIDVGNRKILASSFPLRSVGKSIDLQFFPEGGSLMYGVHSKLGFKALKPDGLGIDLKGTITDNTSKVVAEFATAHNGMGMVEFDPEDGKTYSAHVTFADGTTMNPDLPKIRTTGITLNADNTDPENLKIKIQSTALSFQANQGKTFFIVAKASGIICFAAQTQLKTQVYEASIPKSKFPTGIIQLTIFNSNGEPLSERIVFIQHNDQLSLALKGDLPSYTTRQKVKLGITAKANNLPAEGNFSVTVIDEAKVPFEENAETTILTCLLLTSDIKGYIEKPNYYFNNVTPKTLADLDILMLTQGYRRFSYRDVLNDKYPPINYFAEQGIQITGTLRGDNGIPIKGGNIRLSIPDKNYFENTVSNIEGRFQFSNLVFTDSAKVTLSARNNTRANELVITLDGDPYQRIAANFNTPDEILNIDSALSPYLKNSKVQYNNSHVLKEVVIRDKKTVQLPSHTDYGSLSTLSSDPDHLLKGEQFNSCGSFLDCLKGLAPGMTFDNDNFYVMRDYAAGNRTPVGLFVRGAPVDISYLRSLTPDQVASVEIFLKDQLGIVSRTNKVNGVIVINLKKVETPKKMSLDEIQQLLPKRNEISFTPKGYAAVKTFYSPKYEGPRTNQSTQVDARSTIYWNPNITTDKTGAASLEYYNADGRGTYRAIIEGIDKDGNIGRRVYKYVVK
jgi:hypothetical protein